MNIETLLSRLEKVRPNGSEKWMALCPAHADKNPSLSIYYTGEKILLKCFAGCDTADVLAAIGLTWQDVLPPRTPEEKHLQARTESMEAIHRTARLERLFLAIFDAATNPTQADIQRAAIARIRLQKIEAVMS